MNSVALLGHALCAVTHQKSVGNKSTIQRPTTDLCFSTDDQALMITMLLLCLWAFMCKVLPRKSLFHS